MKKIFYILLSIFISQNIFSQKILVQSNNIQTNIAKNNFINSNTEIQSKITKFNSVASKTGYYNTTIQIVYYDPYIIGSLELSKKNNLTTDLYVEKWKQLHKGTEQKILFLFYKKNKSDNNYTFSKLAVSEYLEENHLFTEIVNYIYDEIMLKEQNEVNIIKKGVNAFKNAFDTQFKDKLVEGARKQINEPKYYKGSCYILFYWFNFIQLHDRNLSQPKLDYPLLELNSDNKLVPKLTDSGKPVKLWGYFEFDYGQNLPDTYAKSIYVDANPRITLKEALSTIPYDRKYIELNHDSIGNCTKYTSLDEFPYSLYSFTVLSLLLPEIKNSPLLFSGGDIFLIEDRYQYTQLLHYGKVIQGEHYSEYKGAYVYPSNTNKQATWCNVFASDLSLYIYGLISGKRAVPSGKIANSLNNYFNSDTKNYIEISNSNNIWRYVNNGYLIIFSKKESKIGHIEIGYPDPYSHSQYFNNGKNRYWNNSAVYTINNNSKNICVGAGGHTGYKTTQSDKNWANSAQKFLYLGYLKQEFNH